MRARNGQTGVWGGAMSGATEYGQMGAAVGHYRM